MASKEPPKPQGAPQEPKTQSLNDEEVLDFSELKPGEYSLHVYIERTRCLVHPEDDGELVDPLIGVFALGKKQFTQPKKRVGLTDKFWGEHLFLEQNISSIEEIKNGKLVIEVSDYNMITKNSLVGNYEMDLAKIYFEKDHCLKYKWLALTNIKKNYTKIMGYVKVSVCLIKSGDKQTMLEQEPLKKGEIEHNTNETQVLLPPQLQQTPGQIVFKLFRAEALKKMDSVYTIDAYCTLDISGFQLRSDTVMNNSNPSWYKEMLIPLFQPTVSQHLNLKLWDYDRGIDDELVGSCKFKIKDIMSGELIEPFWCNMYGSQYDPSNKEQAKIMNNNPELGTYWCGRILVSASYVETQGPQCLMKSLSDKEVKENKMNDDIVYGIQVDAFYGLQLPSDNKYSLTVRWADSFVQTKKIEAKNKLIEWFERVQINCKLPYKSSDTLPDIFIYLTDSDGKHVSYVRENAKKYLIAENMNPSNYFLLPDKSMTQLRCDEAGVINATIIASYEGCLNQPNPLLEACKTKPQNKKSVLSVNLYQCSELIPGDSNGTSDPFVEIYYYGTLLKFPVREDTCNPIWYKTYQIPVSSVNEANPPPILIRVFDEDPVSNDFLGSAIVDVKDGQKKGFIGKSRNDKVQPTWLNLRFSKLRQLFKLQYLFQLCEDKNSQCGKILVSFFIDNQISILQPTMYDLKPKLERYKIQLKILGMRNLKSNGLMPVRRPFIKFDINSLKSIGEYGPIASKNISTEPKGFGFNPTISTVINFDCLLPEDLTLIPFLSCTVYDKIMFGLLQPIIGQFSIDLQGYAIKTKERFASKLLKITEAVKPILEQLVLPQDDEESQDPLVEVQNDKEKLNNQQVVVNIKSVQKSVYKSGVQKFSLYDDTKQIIDENGMVNRDYSMFWANYEIDKATGEVIETNIPDSNCYLPLSYDSRISKINSIRNKKNRVQVAKENEDSTGLVKEGIAINYATYNNIRKHYRYFLNCPLEDTPFIDKDIFDVIYIQQHKRFNEEDMFTDMVLQQPNTYNCGKFKGTISVMKESDSSLVDLVLSEKNDERNKDFMSEKFVLVRLYVIDATNIPKQDELDDSDPYLMVKLGDETQSTRKRFIKDNSSPQFGEMFEFKTCLPGDPMLKIQLWDYDELSVDDFLCETTIDLEDRFFSKKWTKLVNPPIETRPLFHPSSSIQKGQLRLWLEIIPGIEYEKVKQIYHVSPKPNQQFEIRCVIWSVDDIPAQDAEDCSDLFVSARIGEVTKQTDVHYRAQSGEGSFNWRLKFPITLPTNDPVISFQVFDKDLLSPDDFISSASISFENEAIQAFQNDKRVKMYGNKDPDGGISLGASKKKYETLIIPLSNVKKDDTYEGELKMSFEIVPVEEVKSDPVGIGRSEPNHSPHCPQPSGRFSWSWNPYDIFCKLVGPKARAKVCALICIFILLFLSILLIPTIVGDLIGGAIQE